MCANVAAAADLFSIPTYDSSLMWQGSVDGLLERIYDDLRKLIRPAAGRISSGFGKRSHPLLGFTKHHNGIDIACDMKTPIRAVLSGVVRRAGRAGGYGRLIEIKHKDMETRYAHLSKIIVREGQKVSRGEVIGYSGKSGLATGPHLHFELRRGGRVVDPVAMF